MTGPATLGLEGKLGFSLQVPDSWFEFDVHPATRDESVRRLVEDRVRGNQALWEQRAGIMKLLREQAKVAYDAGAAYCSSFVTPTDEGPITGSVTVSLVRGPIGSDAENRSQAILDLYKSVPKPANTDDEFAPFATVATVDIPTCGTCARSYGIEDVEVDNGMGMIRNIFMQTAVPLREFNKVFLISCSSPVVVLYEALFDLFDAVTGTFRLVNLQAQATEAGVRPDVEV